MKKTTLRLLCLLVMMFTMSMPSQASSDFFARLWESIQNAINDIQKSNRYHSVVSLTPVGEGKVYASYGTTASTPSTSDWKAEELVASTPNNGEENPGNQTWQLYAQANNGYTFVGWYDNADCTGNALSTVTPYQVSVSSVHGTEIEDENSSGIHKYWAKFAPATVSVKVTSAGYATFCSEYAVDFTNSGIEAYTLTIDGLSLNLNPITQVPANTGVVLKAEGGAEKDVPTISAIPAVTNNDLVGTNVALVLNENDYILNVVNGKAGFYRVASHPNLAAHRAYIPAASVPAAVSGAASAKGYAFEDDDATGIQEIENAVEDGAIYNMAGQRLNKMQKGINIVNGKKILKK